MPDDTFFPDLFVSWGEVTSSEITAFENALNSARAEGDMQRFLEAHPSMLMRQISAGRGAWVIPQKRLGSEHVTDFLIAQKSSGGFEWHAVELERPQAILFNKNGDPSAALNHALRQIGDWRDWLSHNRDYAARPHDQSGLNLTDIDPELEGLIILGRDANVDPETTERRRRLMRERRVKIETYDWLLYHAREQITVKPEIDASFVDGILGGLSRYARRTEQQARKAVREVFDGIANVSTLGTIRSFAWDEVAIGSDPDPDNNVRIPLMILYKNPYISHRIVDTSDWHDWLYYVQHDLDEVIDQDAEYGLLVLEDTPAEGLLEKLNQERDGIWYEIKWFTSPDKEPLLTCLQVMVHLPPEMRYDEKKTRVSVAREIFQRYIPDPAIERQRKLEQEREAERKIAALSLTHGDVVMHSSFGMGRIVSLSGSGIDAEATIDFGADFGVRLIALRYAPLEKLRLRMQ